MSVEKKLKMQIEKNTINYREQSDGYWRGGGLEDGLNRRWRLRSALVVMSTGCCMEVLNHYTVHLKLISPCM